MYLKNKKRKLTLPLLFTCCSRDILSPLSLTLRSGSFLLKSSHDDSINKLSPCVPRFLCLFIVLMQVLVLHVGY